MRPNYENNLDGNRLVYGVLQKEPLPLSVFLLIPFLIGVVSVSVLPGFNYLVIGFGAISAFAFLLASMRDGLLVAPEIKLFIMFFVWSIFGIFVARFPPLVIEKLRTLVQLIIMVLIVSYYARNSRCVNWMFLGVLAGVLIVATGAVISGDYARAEVEGEEARLAGLALNANVFAIAVVYGVAILLHYFRTLKSKILKLIMIGGILLAVRFVIASGSRKGFIALAILLFFWFIFTYGKDLVRRPGLAVIMLIGMMALVAYITYELRDTTLMQRFLRLKGEAGLEGEGSEGVRMTMIKEGVQFTLQHPVFGLGLNNFIVHSTTGKYAHNNYAEVFSGTGIPGGILYHLIYVLVILRLFRLSKLSLTAASRNVLNIFKTFMVVRLFLDIGVVSYYEKSNWIMMAIMIGFTYSLQSRVTQQQEIVYESSPDEDFCSDGFGR